MVIATIGFNTGFRDPGNAIGNQTHIVPGEGFIPAVIDNQPLSPDWKIWDAMGHVVLFWT